MKEFYTKPQADVETFTVTDIVTTSGTGDDKRDPIELPDL